MCGKNKPFLFYFKIGTKENEVRNFELFFFFYKMEILLKYNLNVYVCEISS